MKHRSLTIIIAEAALEIVPPLLQNHPVIVKSARKRGKSPREILLDISIHYPAMKDRLPEYYKRGRPDLIHITLLNLLESPLNKRGLLRLYIHTINDIVVFIDPKIRLPKNYNRFIGLMEQLFKEGKVPPGKDTKPLMVLRNLSLRDLVKKVSDRKPIILSERGRRKRFRDLVSYLIDNNNPIIIGGFQHGDFSNETYRLTDEVYSVYEESLPTWIVASHLVTLYEDLMNII